MKKNLLSFILIFSFISLIDAQVAIFKSVSFVDSVSQPSLKKYGFKLSCTGFNLPIVFVTIDQSNGNIYYTDSIPNLLNSNSTANDFLTANYWSFAINGNDLTDTLMFLQPTATGKNILSTSLISSPTSALNCDGKIHLNLNTSVPSVNSAVLFFGERNNWNQITSSPPYNLDTLCSGNYVSLAICSVELTPGNIVNPVENISYLIGQSAFPSSTGLNVNVNSYKQANTPTCDGKARVSITNSVVPFLCSFDGGAFASSDSVINLCEGMHRVLVATANDTVGKYFIIASSGNVINNPNTYGLVVDTIIYNYTNCNFDYNLPIDSAFLVNYNAIDSNTIFLSWEIWQGGTLTAVSDTVSFNYQAGNNMISLMIFCGNARTASVANFKTFRINDYANLSNTVTSIKDNQSNSNFELYPNPFSTSISIKSKDKFIINSIELYNVLGERVEINYQSHGREMVIDTEYLKTGFYTISIISKSGLKSTYKVIKQ